MRRGRGHNNGGLPWAVGKGGGGGGGKVTGRVEHDDGCTSDREDVGQGFCV